MSSSDKQSQKSGVFIGARDLKEEVYKILPTFDLLVKQIEQLRIGAQESKNIRKDVNNTIGIFGARGTGKTSVLYTLINKLSPDVQDSDSIMAHHNIILPIIEPDLFGDNSKIMGSVVGLLKRAVEQQLKRIQQLNLRDLEGKEGFDEYFSKGIYKSNNPLQNSLNELIEYHMYTASEYRKLLIHTYDDLATHIRKSARLLTPDIEFKEKLHWLISSFIENQRALLHLSIRKSEEEPILFLFIDDIDLKMTRSKELVEAILQYANHPNIITVLSGDYYIMQESIMLGLIQDERLSQGNLSVHFKVNAEHSIKDRKQFLAHEYLKKIIPPARRHQLLKWNINTLPKFAFGKQSLMDVMDRLLGVKNVFSYTTDGSEERMPINNSYSIFDTTPRGIINVYYHIHEINERYPDFWQKHQGFSDEEKQNWFNTVKSLIDTILLSSTTLLAKQSDIINGFIQWGHDASSTILHYSKLEEVVALNKKEDNSAIIVLDFALLLPLVIIGEIIQQLLKEVRYDEAVRNFLQNKLLLNLLKMDNLDDINLVKLGRVAKAIVNFISFQNSLFFINQIEEHSNWLIESYNKANEESIYTNEIKDQWMLLQINKLLSNDKEPDLLTNLYYDAYVTSKSKRKNRYVHNVLQFLNNTSTRRKDFVYYQSMYEYPKGQGYWRKLTTMPQYNTDYVIELFINMIIQIQTRDSDDFNHSFKDLIVNENVRSNPAASRLRTVLNKLTHNQTDSGQFKPNQINIISRLISDFYKELFNGFKRAISNEGKLRILWRDSSIINLQLNVFDKGVDGSSGTNYSKVKQEFRQLLGDYTDYNTYRNCRLLLEDLSNNFKVWYGRKEAKELSADLQAQAYLDPAILLADELWVIKNLIHYLNKVNTSVFVDTEYEQVKMEMRVKLDEAFDQAKQLATGDLKMLGMELWEDEVSGEDDDAG